MTSIYKPIQHNQVRLIKFSHNGDHTSAILQTFYLQGPIPPYHALSYTWLSDNLGVARNYALEIEKQQLLVLDSLRPFFHALSLKGALFDDVWWWIDSICIDLENLEERVQQVQLMGRIYHDAHKVICWLGEESDDTDCAIDFIELLNKVIRQQVYSTEQIRSMFQQDHYNPHWAALTNFFRRRWWTRIWTLQEYAISTCVSFWYGTRSVSRIAVEGALMAGDQCTALTFKSIPTFRHAWNRRRVWRLYDLGKRNPGANKVSLSLVALAAYSSCFEAADDRDRLYGIRALATDAFLLNVDYSLSVEEVYLRFTKSFIEHYKSLDIICFASIYRAPPNSLLPSWVPDWRVTVDPLVLPLMVSQSARTHIGNLRPPRKFDEPSSASPRYAASRDSAAVYRFEGSKLLVHGTVLDTVDGLAGSRSTELVQSSSVVNSPQLPTGGAELGACSSSDILRSICRSLALDRKDRYLQIAMPVEDFLGDFMWLCAHLIQVESTTPLVPKEFQEWFDGTKSLRIHGHSFESIVRDSSEVIDIINSLLSLAAPNRDESVMDTFFNRFFDTIVRMSFRLMVTRNGHIGLAPYKAMKGDLVCVLSGCSVPVLLRRRSDDEEGWTFMGECFLDGFMEGSCPKQLDLMEKRFSIG